VLDDKEKITYIFAIGAAQGLLLAIFFFNKKKNRTANRLLSATMLIFATDLISGVTYLAGYIKNIPLLFGFRNTLPYLYGPAIFTYTLILMYQKEGFKKSYWLHKIPFLQLQRDGVFFFYFEDVTYQLNQINFVKPTPWHLELVRSLIPIHGITYTALAVIQVFKFNRRLKDSSSNIERIICDKHF